MTYLILIVIVYFIGWWRGMKKSFKFTVSKLEKSMLEDTFVTIGGCTFKVIKKEE